LFKYENIQIRILFIYENCAKLFSFKFEFCSYTKFVQIRKLFVYDFLFKLEKCSNFDFCSYINFCSNSKIVLFLNMTRSENIWIKKNKKRKKERKKKKKRKRISYLLLRLTGAIHKVATLSGTESRTRWAGYRSYPIRGGYRSSIWSDMRDILRLIIVGSNLD
jgi:hypothetical protein